MTKKYVHHTDIHKSEEAIKFRVGKCCKCDHMKMTVMEGQGEPSFSCTVDSTAILHVVTHCNKFQQAD